MATKRNGALNVAALIDKMKLEVLDTASLTPYARNPRDNEEAVASVAASIKSFGFRVPIVVHGADNEIINGHTRWKAANKLGLKRVPCLRADELTETEVKALRLADNKVSELAKWNEDLLKLEVEDIGDAFDLGDFGFGDLTLGGENSGEGEGEGNGEGGEEINPNSSCNYQEQYGVIVMCKNETEQAAIYEKLSGMGYECKVVAT